MGTSRGETEAKVAVRATNVVVVGPIVDLRAAAS
jgi:hypothetical protein